MVSGRHVSISCGGNRARRGLSTIRGDGCRRTSSIVRRKAIAGLKTAYGLCCAPTTNPSRSSHRVAGATCGPT